MKVEQCAICKFCDRIALAYGSEPWCTYPRKLTFDDKGYCQQRKIDKERTTKRFRDIDGLAKGSAQEYHDYIVELLSKRHRMTTDDWKRMYTEEQFAELIRVNPDLEEISQRVYECTANLILTKLHEIFNRDFIILGHK